ncbi:RHS repeat-associated core domain-containing protein [Pseudomonas beijingensis]|uniref:RHS repeat-associated core domain-containing protein n=1 Tax=Pseudomonas beijingensis TaxID=2954101 RepID=A0ABY9F713_9PSED|nr:MULTISPECIES: RHS repeat-associated core domain-containing protein [unclassified Pseudomonas]WLG99091.1 RHS repeat-associated core domain-containing protein [Pseudomonas sp. FP2034]WLI44190.1 RHS repeat-associated core domain-containing protein [Pseudomonas sp. FP830]
MSTSTMKILCRYQYDPLDRLTGLKPAEHVGTQRFYQNDELVNEIEGQVELTILRHEAQPLAQRLHVANVTETTLLATDRQRSVMQTLAGVDTQRMAYTAYGHRPAESGLSSLLGFNGERPDPITGHYLLGQGNRAFNPVLMRFNSPDAYSPFGDGGINAYAYCGGDPVNRYDPSGNNPITLITSAFKPWNRLTTNMPGVLDLSLSPAVLQPAAPKPVAPVAPRLRELLQQPGPSPRVGASSTSAPSPAIPKKITYEGRRRPWIQERTDAAGEVNGTTMIHRRRADKAYAYDILARNEQIPPIVEDPVLRENFKATRKRYRTTKRNKKSGQSDRSEYTDAASKFQTARRALKIDNLKKIRDTT